LTPQEAYKALGLANGLGIDRAEAEFVRLKAEMEKKMAQDTSQQLKDIYKSRLDELENAFSVLVEYHKANNSLNPAIYKPEESDLNSFKTGPNFYRISYFILLLIAISITVIVLQNQLSAPASNHADLKPLNSFITDTTSKDKSPPTQREDIKPEDTLNLPIVDEKLVAKPEIKPAQQDYSELTNNQFIRTFATEIIYNAPQTKDVRRFHQILSSSFPEMGSEDYIYICSAKSKIITVLKEKGISDSLFFNNLNKKCP
jgi:hypothetical protein